MLKYIVLIKAAPGEDRKLFRQRFPEQVAPKLAAEMRGLLGFTTNVVDVVPHWPDQPATRPPGAEPDFDIVAEMWFDTALNARQALARFDNVSAYRVTEFIEKDVGRDAGAPHRVKLFSFIHPVAGLSDHEFKRHWEEHVPIALRVHAACRQYVRHWVEEVLSGDAPGVRGVGMIGMRNQEDLEQCLFDSPAGVAEVAADTAEFVGKRLVVYATEHCDLQV